MLFEVGVTHNRSNKASGVLNTHSVSLRIRTVKGQMEVEVRILLLKSKEVLHKEYLINSTSAIEVVHLTVTSMKSLEHVHNLSTQRSHTGATTYPNHLTLAVKVWMELSVRTTHDNLVTRLE